jgi:hypothetical protein
MMSQAAGATPKQSIMDLTIQGKYIIAYMPNGHDCADENFSFWIQIRCGILVA